MKPKTYQRRFDSAFTWALISILAQFILDCAKWPFWKIWDFFKSRWAMPVLVVAFEALAMYSGLSSLLPRHPVVATLFGVFIAIFTTITLFLVWPEKSEG